jgi:hypothetical protein
MTTYKDGLYHKDIYFPPLKLANKNIQVFYTCHAIKSAETDRYEVIQLPNCINPSLGEPIEVEIKNNCLVKIIIRFSYSKEYDLIMAFLPDTWSVKTTWLNEKGDVHKTLNPSRCISKPTG